MEKYNHVSGFLDFSTHTEVKMVNGEINAVVSYNTQTVYQCKIWLEKMGIPHNSQKYQLQCTTLDPHLVYGNWFRQVIKSNLSNVDQEQKTFPH
jgi:hypothetical protein